MLNYLPSVYRYDDHSEFDSVQHIVRLQGGYKTSNLTLRLIQDIAILNNIVLAAASEERSGLGTRNGRTDLDIYNTDLNANYNMTPRDFIFAELRMNRTEYAQPLISSELYVADLYLNHGFSDKLVLGVGVEGGYNAVDFPTRTRQWCGPTRGTYSTPVFAISATSMPCDSTKIVLNATRQIYNSAARTAQDYVDTNVSGMIRARVCKQLYLTLLGGYEHVEYFNTIDLPIPLPTLRDDYFYVQPSADILLTRYWSFGGYYLRRQNSGSISTVDFYSNEAGVRTTIKF